MKRGFEPELPSRRQKVRTSSSSKSGLTKAGLQAYWSNKKFGAAQPWSTYGAERVERGTPGNLAKYGVTYKAASAAQRDLRKMSGYSGRGNYKKAMHSLHRGIKKARIGQRLTKFAKKEHLGQLAMDNALMAAKGYTGMGGYRGRGGYIGRGGYTSNSLMEGGKPSMTGTIGGENQGVMVTHREYLQDVYGPDNAQFTLEKLAINPGLMQNFPWLSQIAANYEEYEFKQLVFEFHSTVDPSATNNSSGSTGTLIMATNYNPDAKPFVTKEVMMQYHGACNGRVTEDLIAGVEANPALNAGSAIKYTRTTTPVSQSLKDFDLGLFQWALVNIPPAFENQQVGELWCYYTVELSKPRLYASVYRNLAFDQWYSTLNTLENTIDWEVWAPFGNINPTDQGSDAIPEPLFKGVGNSLSCKITNLSVKNVAQTVIEVEFPDFETGTYEIVYNFDGNNLSLDTTQDPLVPIYAGACTGIKDCWGQNFGFNGPTTVQENRDSYVASSQRGGVLIVQHVNIVPATPAAGGAPPVNASATLTLSWASGFLSNTIITIKPYNPYLQAIQSKTGQIVYNPEGLQLVSGAVP